MCKLQDLSAECRGARGGRAAAAQLVECMGLVRHLRTHGKPVIPEVMSGTRLEHAGGDGRTSAHDPRLLAAQQPSCHEQVSAGDFEDQTLGAGQAGRRYFAGGVFCPRQDPMNAVGERFRMETFSSGAYRPLTSPDLLEVRIASA